MYGLIDELDTDKFETRDILARTAWGEARGEGEIGMHAVLNTVQRRLSSKVKWWGFTLRQICLARYQYSCWDKNDPNRAKIMAVIENDPQYEIALQLADKVLAGSLLDLVNCADSYIASSLKKQPYWCKNRKPVKIIGHHSFYCTIDEVPPPSVMA